MTAGQRLFVGLLIAALLGGSILYSSKATGEAEVIGVATLEFHLELKQGWNLVAWGSDTQPPDSAFASIASYHLVMAYGWQNDTQSFNRYVPGRPEISTLSEVEKDNAYWLLMKGEFLLFMPPSASECPAPTVTPCPTCPLTPDSRSVDCAGVKVSIELDELLLEIAKAGELVGPSGQVDASEVEARLADSNEFFDTYCQGVDLSPSLNTLLTLSCAEAGKWKGSLSADMFYAPSSQTSVWLSIATGIVAQYCKPS